MMCNDNDKSCNNYSYFSESDVMYKGQLTRKVYDNYKTQILSSGHVLMGDLQYGGWVV